MQSIIAAHRVSLLHDIDGSSNVWRNDARAVEYLANELGEMPRRLQVIA